MASAIESPIHEHVKNKNLIDAFQRLDTHSIKKLAHLMGSYYQSLNRN